MVREAIDDIRRFRRDREINGKKYKKLTPGGIVYVSSADIKVGDLIIVEKVSYCLHFFKPYSTQVPKGSIVLDGAFCYTHDRHDV